MQARFLGVAVVLTALCFHGAIAGNRWQGLGWYIVTATRTGAAIRDGKFPDAGACRSELSRDQSLAKHNEFDADACVILDRDVAERDGPASSALRSSEDPTQPLPGAQPPAPRLPLPRFASLKSEGVQVRRAPSRDAALRWIYLRKGWPVEIIAENGDWREIQDTGGETGWVSKDALDTVRTAILSGSLHHAIRAKPNSDAQRLAWAEPDTLINLQHCDFLWCEVHEANVTGFVERSVLWGILPAEWIE